MNQAVNRQSHHGFTVVELLVVVGIVAVLLGVAIPAVSKIRASAQRLECLSQMRGLQTAYLAYAADNNGRLLPFQDGPHLGLTDAQIEQAEQSNQPIWYFVLQDYYDTPLILKSPLDDSPHWPAEMGGGTALNSAGTQFRRTSYGLNDYLMVINPAEAIDDPINPDPSVVFNRLTKIRSPANTVGFGIVSFAKDAAHPGSDHFHPFEWLYMSTPELLAEEAARYIQTNAHGGPAKTFDARSGYSFLDGHVSTTRFGDIAMPGTDEGTGVNLAATYNKFDPRAAVAYAAQQFINPQ